MSHKGLNMKLIAIALLAIMALGVSPAAYAASPYFDGNVSIPEAAAAGIITAACGGAGLTPGTGKVSPFYIDATGALCTNANSGAITVNQGTSPWIVDTTGSGVLDGELTAPIAAQIAAGVLIGSTQISDGACSSSPCATNATVKAASTAPTATDKALVVSLSPNGQAVSADPCSYSKKATATFNITSSGASFITATASDYTYICQMTIATTTLTNFSIVAGTGSSVCTGGSPYPIWGNPGETASNGASIGTSATVGGGVSVGNGSATIAGGSIGGTVNYNLCALITTTNTPTVNGTVLYVQTAN